MMSPGHEHEVSTSFLTQSTSVDFKQLSRLDVLGLADSSANDQDVVYSEFKEQLVRHPDGSYVTGLPWKGSHPTLPTNECGILKRLQQLLRKLERTNTYDQYDAIIQEQREERSLSKRKHQPTIFKRLPSFRTTLTESFMERFSPSSLLPCFANWRPAESLFTSAH